MADLENTILMDLANAKGEAKGRVTIELLPQLAPGHVARIKELAREGFYDGVVFHRVIEGFMAQGGDPTGTGTGGSKKPNLKAEFSKLGKDLRLISAATHEGTQDLMRELAEQLLL